MISLDLEVKSKKWLEQKNIEKFVRKTCEKIIPLTDLKKILKKKFTLELAISLVSNQQIKKINSEFRGKNSPTDVLSFSQLDENFLREFGIVKAAVGLSYLFLGDIVIAYEITKKDAEKNKKKFEYHLSHLILHALLHLLGHDHEDEKMAEKMEKIEIKILKQLGIQNPYRLN